MFIHLQPFSDTGSQVPVIIILQIRMYGSILFIPGKSLDIDRMDTVENTGFDLGVVSLEAPDQRLDLLTLGAASLRVSSLNTEYLILFVF